MATQAGAFAPPDVLDEPGQPVNRSTFNHLRRTHVTDTLEPAGAHAPDTRPSNGHSTGARAVDGEGHRKRRLGWLWWLLGLLALAAIIALLVGLTGGDDGDERTATPSGQNEPSGQSAGAGGTTAAGELGAGDVKLLPVPNGGFAGSVGDSAQGRDVVVQSVVRGQEDPNALEGF